MPRYPPLGTAFACWLNRSLSSVVRAMVLWAIGRGFEPRREYFFRGFHFMICVPPMPITCVKHDKRHACRDMLNNGVTFEWIHMCNKSPLASALKTHTRGFGILWHWWAHMEPRCQMLKLYNRSCYENVESFGSCVSNFIGFATKEHLPNYIVFLDHVTFPVCFSLEALPHVVSFLPAVVIKTCYFFGIVPRRKACSGGVLHIYIYICDTYIYIDSPRGVWAEK